MDETSLKHLATEHAMRLTARDDLVSLLLQTRAGGAPARTCVGRILHDSGSALSHASPLGAWASGACEIDNSWHETVPLKERSLLAQLEFLSLMAPEEVLREPCPYRRLELARQWASSRADTGPDEPTHALP